MSVRQRGAPRLRPALIALQFLTCFPIRLQPPPGGREVGLSLLWYPAVGLLLGVLLFAAAAVLSGVASPLAAALVLALWVTCTGALHLDGLADTADGWVGGRGDRERTLEIMKDPRSGPIGVAALVCVLLLKFAALSALGDAGTVRLCGYILPPVLARGAVPLLFAHTPYARADGIGADIAKYQSRTAGRWVATLAALLPIVVCARHGVTAVAATGAIYLLMRRAFVGRLGGVTGDCVGAMIEVMETTALVALTIS